MVPSAQAYRPQIPVHGRYTTSKVITPVVSIICYFHQRGSLLRKCSGSAVPPCPTVPHFSSQA